MNILDIKRWKNILSGSALSTNILDEYSKERMIELWRLTSIFQQDKTSSRRYFWIKTDDYTLDDFKKNEDYDELSDEEIKKLYEQSIEWYSPWIKITCVSYCLSEEDDLFYGIFIDSDYVLAINDPNSKGWPLDATELIDWLIEKITDIKDNLKNGIYESLVEEVPYKQRKGIISRKILWDIVPGERKAYRNLFKEEEIEFFLNGVFDNPKYFKKVTARNYYEACATVYRALGFNDENCNSASFNDTKEERCYYKGTTPRELYYTYADKRDDGLRNVPLDDECAFKEWLQSEGPYYEFNGHHPWEIIPSFSISNSLHLYMCKACSDNKYYLKISGATKIRSAETIKGFLALVKAGYPVVLDNLDVLRNRLLETDYIGIVEDSLFSFCKSTIAGKDVHDYISLDDYYENKNICDSIIKKAKWEPLEIASLY